MTVLRYVRMMTAVMPLPGMVLRIFMLCLERSGAYAQNASVPVSVVLLLRVCCRSVRKGTGSDVFPFDAEKDKAYT